MQGVLDDYWVVYMAFGVWTRGFNHVFQAIFDAVRARLRAEIFAGLLVALRLSLTCDRPDKPRKLGAIA